MRKTSRLIGTLALVLVLGVFPAFAAGPAELAAGGPVPADDEVTVLETLVVSGELPGPGLWKVSREGRVLWVLGTVAPLPKRMEWTADEVRERIAASGVVLLPPRARLKTRGGRLGAMFLLPSALRARDNPGKQTLQDVLPAPDHARWQRLKALHMGRDRGVEKRRPMLAALELREEAFEDHDLSWRDVVGREVRRTARRSGVAVREPGVTLQVDNARAALKEFSRSQLDDLECFRLTLDQVENDLDTLAVRANAWALGEVAVLLDLPYTDNSEACLEALLETGLAQRKGMDALPAQVEAAWLEAARSALAGHPESFAVLPISRIVGERSYLRRLAQEGYAIEAPAKAGAGD